jgi:uncharacterized protein
MLMRSRVSDSIGAQLKNAQRLGVHGGSAFKAIEGFGRHGALHSQHFFELAGEMTVEVEFILTDEMVDRMLESPRGAEMTEIYGLASLRLGLALVATLLSIWLRIATAMSEIIVGTVPSFCRAICFAWHTFRHKAPRAGAFPARYARNEVWNR